MRYLVTGAAGFIGSHLCERLLADGHTVIGVDCFVPYYPIEIKHRNLRDVSAHSRFQFLQCDLRTDDLVDMLADVDIIYHLAAMPGLIRSWTDFDGYWSCNVLATQRLLEAVRPHIGRLKRFIYGSTSSAYGKFASGDESLPTRPISPYGVTKLASEHLCRAHAEAYELPLVVLRYFSVYGPRQRPDMAYNLFIQALMENQPIRLYGDGKQVRGNTYVADCVQATMLAAQAPIGELYNVGGGEAVSVWDVLSKLEAISGRRFVVESHPERAGDQRHTFADTSKLFRHLGWKASTPMDEGLRRQWEWQRDQRLA